MQSGYILVFLLAPPENALEAYFGVFRKITKPEGCTCTRYMYYVRHIGSLFENLSKSFLLDLHKIRIQDLSFHAMYGIWTFHASVL